MTWARVQLKQVASVSVSNVDKKSSEHERSVRLCNYVDVYKNDLIDASLDFMQATASPSQIRSFGLRAGDTVITKDSETADDIAVPAYVGETVKDLVCGYHLAVARPGPTVDPKYLFWCLASQSMRDQAAVAATGVTRFGLRQESMRNTFLSLPGLDEQKRIADFLDAETTRLDRLIKLRERQAALVDERLSSVLGVRIAAADASPRRLFPMLALLRDGTHTPPARVDDGVPLLSVRNIQNGRIAFRDDDSRVSRSDALTIQHGCPARNGDVALAIIGATLGKAALIDLTGAYCFQRSVAILRTRPDLLRPRFLLWILRSQGMQDQLWLAAGFSAQPGVYLNSVASLLVLTPPLHQQDSIIEEMDRVESQTTSTKRLSERSLTLLTERRQALITAAVTGQLDVATAQGVS